MKKKILIIAAHPDDEVLGCGGAIIKHLKQKDSVYIMFLTNGISSRTKNYRKLNDRKKHALNCAKFL